jgi:hypothetical protein
LVGFHSEPGVVVVVVVVLVDFAEVVVDAVFFDFDEPLPLAVVDEGPLALVVDFAEGPFVVEPFAVEGAFVVVVLAGFGVLVLVVFFGAASRFNVSAAAATTAAGSAIHLVIAPPCPNRRATVMPLFTCGTQALSY